MASIVVPFHGAGGKRRLEPERIRSPIALAMLADVLAACAAVAETVLVTADEEGAALASNLAVRTVPDPGRGQGAAVAAGLAAVGGGSALVVNADLPCAQPRDLLTLLGGLPAGGIALVRGADGTTNALALASPALFAPLYGPGSERRFREHAARLGVEAAVAEIPNLAEDVDTLDDLERLEECTGPCTREALAALRVGLAR